MEIKSASGITIDVQISAEGVATMAYNHPQFGKIAHTAWYDESAKAWVGTVDGKRVGVRLEQIDTDTIQSQITEAKATAEAARNAALEQHIVLARSGSYLMDEAICRIGVLADADQSKYAEWCRGKIAKLITTMGQIKIKRSATAQAIIADKSRTTYMYGQESQLIVITEAEANQIMAECAATDKPVQVEAAPEPEKHGPGYCYSCGTYCYGDCGHYEPKRTLKHVMADAQEAARESMAGIQEGA